MKKQETKSPVILFLGLEQEIESGLRQLLKSRVKRFITTQTRNDVLDMLKTAHVDIFVWNRSTEKNSGMSFLQEVLKNRPELKMVVKSTDPDWELAIAFIRAGVDQYLRNHPKRESFVYAVEMTVLKWYAEKEESGSLRRVMAENHPPRVLVVEDNAVNMELMVLMLEKTGCSVDTATQGQKALSRIAERDYDLVLMDLHMPVMDGLETVKAIRKMKGKKSRIPVIAFTAHISEEERQNCLRNGMNDCMVKPTTKEILLALIQKYIYHTGYPRENGKSGEEGQAPESWLEFSGSDEQQSQYPVIDESVLFDFSDGDSSVIEKFIGLFMEESTKEISLLEKALEDQDITEVEKLAHSIKGAAAEVGGKRLSYVARNMEKAAENKDLVFCQAILEPLKSEWENVKKYLLHNFICKEGDQPDDQTRKR